MHIDGLPAGYSGVWGVDPGERVQLRASGAGPARATLVRLRGLVGEATPTGYIEEIVGPPIEVALEERAVPMGSYAWTESGPAAAAHEDWEWTFRLFPTLVDGGEVLAWGHDGPRLAISAGHLAGTWRSAVIAIPIIAGSWSEVRFGCDSTGLLSLTLTPVGPGAWYRRAERAQGRAAPVAVAGPLRIGRGLNGKVEGPTLVRRDGLAGRWDFAGEMRLQRVPGEGPDARPLLLVNAPRRAVTSSAWTGESHDWTMRPAHYNAIHFHEDDLADCGWPVTSEHLIPADRPSGIHAIRVESAEGTCHAPVFVRPRRPVRVVFLASTLTYLAYSNSLWSSPSGSVAGHRYPRDAGLARRFGLSTYSRHRDGSGIGLVSSRRPLLHATPGFLGEAIGGQVALNDDLRILRWLDRVGEPYAVVTDHDLHARGGAVLDGAGVLVTGVHPEYHTGESLDAIETFLARGGRLMYLGGNGFYWRVSTLPDAPHVMELRRAEGGVRIWAEPAGEYHHQSDGRLGGLWRRLGRTPNALVGVGFSAQGHETETRPYVATAAARDPRAAFLFEGVTAQEIGAPGPLGAAAGYEIDRADTALGTPPHALVVARSAPFGPKTAPVNEERLTHELVDATDPLRADMTFFEGPNGGAVFSAGSLLFGGALGETDGAGRIATNALTRFADPNPFLIPETTWP